MITKDFIEQTAWDYDVDVEVVEDILRDFGEDVLYEKLEEYLREHHRWF